MVAILILSGCAQGRARPEVDQGVLAPVRDDQGAFAITLDQGGLPDDQICDAAIVAGDTATEKPPAVPPTACEKRCTDQAPFLCVTKPSTGRCVECLSDSDCKGNPGAPGSVCENNYCKCNHDSDCKGKALGSECNPHKRICSCWGDSCCGAGLECIGRLFGVKICKAPCAGDADCADHMFDVVCHPQHGCVECVTSADCDSGSTGTSCHNGFCFCDWDEECAGNLNGKRCIDHVCACSTDSDCPSGRTCLGEYLGDRFCL